MRHSRVIVALCALSAACAQTDASHTVVVTDSAGVSIVQVPEMLFDEAELDTLAAPSLTIGGSPGGDLAWITSVMLLDDGAVAFINGAASEVRLHAADGAMLASFGRAGEGPGEFQAPARLFAWAGDSIAVWDVALRRLSVFSRAGELGRTLQVPSLDGSQPDVHGVTAGYLLASPEDGYKGRDRDRVRRDTLNLYRIGTPVGEPLHAGRYPGQAQYEMAVPPVVLLEAAPFGPFSSLGVVEDRTVVADNGAGTITVMDSVGRIERILRFTLSPKPVTADDRRAFEASNVDQSWRPTYLAAKRRFLAEAPVPAVMPRMGEMILGHDGSYWVAEYVPGHDRATAARTWWVLSPAGAIERRVTTPARFTLHAVREDVLAGVQRDEVDVESVVVYPIQPGRR